VTSVDSPPLFAAVPLWVLATTKVGRGMLQPDSKTKTLPYL